MNRISVPALLVCACFLVSAAHATNYQLPPVEIAQTIAKCESCHGPKGDSTKPDVPRLNGQHYGYIVARLKNFRDPTREDPHAINAMWSVATGTGDEMEFALASYFSSQPRTEVQAGGGALAAAGRKIFLDGLPARSLPACQTCHGAHGEGGGDVPRLAGQHAAYLTHAMEVFHFALRESDTMHPRLNGIDEDQIEALVAYLAKD